VDGPVLRPVEDPRGWLSRSRRRRGVAFRAKRRSRAPPTRRTQAQPSSRQPARDKLLLSKGQPGVRLGELGTWPPIIPRAGGLHQRGSPACRDNRSTRS
jgi:hypothetical protein